jgi:hypothetical protein
VSGVVQVDDAFFCAVAKAGMGAETQNPQVALRVKMVALCHC